MTDPGPDEGVDPAAPAPPPPSPDRSTAAGLFRFSVEGRRGPGLFVAGWLATVIGLGAAFVGLLAGATPAGSVLWVIGLAVAFGGLLLLGGSQAIERQAAGLAYSGPSPILVFATTIVGLFVAVAIVGTPLRMLGLSLDGPSLALLGVVIQAAVVVVVLRVLVVGTGALGWGEMGLTASAPAAVRDLAWGAVFAMPVIFVTDVVVAGLVAGLGVSPESPLPPTGSPGGIALNLVAGAVIAPVYEELLFRGFATTAWARLMPAITAVVRTSILFALAHVLTLGGEDFEQGLRLALVGAAGRLPVALALGWVFVRRRSLWAPIGLHAAFNGILLVLAEVAFENLPSQ